VQASPKKVKSNVPVKNQPSVVEAKGGKGAFKYAWNNPELSGKDPAGVSAGDYVVTVTDAAGSTQTASIRVKSPQPLTASAIAQGVVSAGGSDGKALCMTSGGALGKIGHSFLWDNGEITAATLRLNAGLHYVTVTDENGCTATASVMMTENVLPLEVAVTEKTAIKCTGEKAALSVQASGGKGNFKYAWNNPALSGESPNAAAGDYILTVTDAAGTTKTVSVKVSAPAPLSLSVEAQGPLSPGKSDGKALAKPAGGTSPFKIQWDNGENHQRCHPTGAGRFKSNRHRCQRLYSHCFCYHVRDLFAACHQHFRKNQTSNALVKQAALGGAGFRRKSKLQICLEYPALAGEAPSAVAGDYVLTVTDATGTTKTASVSV
jgi:hypothetical protein